MKPRCFTQSTKITLLAAIVGLFGTQSGIPHHKDNTTSGSSNADPNPVANVAGRVASIVDSSLANSSCTSSSYMANAIAYDAGGHPDQYSYYAENLARTLSQLSADQRSRIFKN